MNSKLLLSLVAVLVFYILLLICAVASLVAPSAFAYWVWTFYPAVQVKIAIWMGAIFATGWLLVAHVRAVVFVLEDAAQGQPPDALGLPRLTALVNEVETALTSGGHSVRRFDSVEVTLGVTAMTTTRWRRRRLILGWGLIRMLGEHELKAVVAHEFAHHINGSMAFIWAVARISTSIGRWREHFIQGLRYVYLQARENLLGRFCLNFAFLLGFVSAGLPFLLFRSVEALLQRIAKKSAHTFEFECDRIANGSIGGGAMAGALYQVHRAGIAWSHAMLQWDGVERFWRSYDGTCEHDEHVSEDLRTWRERESPTHPSLDSRLSRLSADGTPSLERARFVSSGDRARVDEFLEAPAQDAARDVQAFAERVGLVVNAVDALRGRGSDAVLHESLIIRACAVILELAPNRGRQAIEECLVRTEKRVPEARLQVVQLHPPDQRIHSLVRCALSTIDEWMEVRGQTKGSDARKHWSAERHKLEKDRLGIDSNTTIRELEKRLNEACGAIAFIAPNAYAYARFDGRVSLFTFE